MPIQNKDLGKYNRPGIFINEIDNSIIELPRQDVLINLVPGMSKKGPVNNPIYIVSEAEFISIFGDIDIKNVFSGTSKYSSSLSPKICTVTDSEFEKSETPSTFLAITL